MDKIQKFIELWNDVPDEIFWEGQAMGEGIITLGYIMLIFFAAFLLEYICEKLESRKEKRKKRERRTSR